MPSANLQIPAHLPALAEVERRMIAEPCAGMVEHLARRPELGLTRRSLTSLNARPQRQCLSPTNLSLSILTRLYPSLNPSVELEQVGKGGKRCRGL